MIWCWVLFLSLVLPTLGLIQRIAVIGSGTGGLSFAASLKQLQSGVREITVFESRQNFLQAELGGGVQLTGGAAVLRNINCLPDLKASAQPLRKIVSRKWNGEQLLALDIHSAIRQRPSAVKSLCEGGTLTGEPMTFAIMRDELLAILYKATQRNHCSMDATVSSNLKTRCEEGPAKSVEVSHTETSIGQCTVTVVPCKRCIAVKEENDGTASISFADGSIAVGYDMVVGADGVGSTLREIIGSTPMIDLSPFLSHGKSGDSSDDTHSDEKEFYSKRSSLTAEVARESDNVPSMYTGIRITYCVTPPSGAKVLSQPAESPLQKQQMIQAGTAKQNPSEPRQDSSHIWEQTLRANDRDAFHQWLGDGAYALTGSYGGRHGIQHMLAVVYADANDAPHGENPNWLQTQLRGQFAEEDPPASSLPVSAAEKAAGSSSSSSLSSLTSIISPVLAPEQTPLGTQNGAPETPDTVVTTSESVQARLRSRLHHAGFGRNQEIQQLLSAASDPGGRFFDLAVRDRTVPLGSWASSSGRLLLMGDSAHAM